MYISRKLIVKTVGDTVISHKTEDIHLDKVMFYRPKTHNENQI